MSEIDMSQFDDLPVSDMARSRAKEVIEGIMNKPDLSDRMTELISSSLSARSLTEGYSGNMSAETISAMIHGIGSAARALIDSGMNEQDFPVERLIHRAITVDLGSMMLGELAAQERGVDIRTLYLPRHGGQETGDDG